MSKSLILLLGVLMLSMRCVEIQEDEGVVILTDANYETVLKDNEHVLVEFYAPWCGHCKKLAPEYVKAAAQLKEEGSKVVLAKLDATEQKATAEQLQIKGYPTLKWFVNGKDTEYKGGRVASEIVSWINKKTGPAVSKIDNDKLSKMKESDKIFYVQVGDIKEQTEKLAQELDDVVIVNIDTLEGYKCGDLVAIRQFDEKEVKCEDCTTLEESQKFIDNTRVPRVMDFDQDAAQHIFGGQKSSIVLFIDEEQHTNEKQMLIDSSEQIRELGLVLAHSQITKDIGLRLAEYIGVKPDQLPKVMILEFIGQDISKYTLEKDITTDNLVEFATQWKNKQLKKEFKSAPVPESTHDGNVRTIVGTNFHEIVGQDADVLVEFYAPWCGHCKKLTPIYESVALKFRPFDKLVIAKVDSTENEIDGIAIQGFPTLKFFKRGSVTPIDYESGRDEAAFEKYLLENVEGLKEWKDGQPTEAVTETETKAEETKEDL